MPDAAQFRIESPVHSGRRAGLGPWLDGAVIIMFALLVITPWHIFLESKVSLTGTLASPSLGHPLGQDNLGRDLLVRIAEAVRFAVLPLWGVLLLVIGLATGVAALAVTSRSVVAKALQASAAIVASVPVGISVFALSVFWVQAGFTPVLVALAMVCFAKLVIHLRHEYERDRSLGFMQAAEALGCHPVRIFFRHGLLTSWWPGLLTFTSLHLVAAVTIEASLSYLGFGVQEPSPSLGNMLASHFDLYLKGELWILAVTCAATLLCSAFPVSLARFFGRGRRPGVSGT